jgi:ABC-type phosphate/phosphonate transport system substrate-binding protein
MRLTRIVILGLLIGFLGCAGGQQKPAANEPVSMTAIDRNFFNVVLRFGPVADELRKELKCPVNLKPNWDIKQVKVHLESSREFYDVLYVDPVEFCRINEVYPLTPVAVRVNLTGCSTEVGLIVVPKKSRITKLEDLKDKRFAFGPYDSAYQFFNVLEMFKAGGFPTSLLKNVSYGKDSLTVAQRVLMNMADAGVVTQSWWQTTGDRSLDFTRLLKDDLRIIGQTEPMPEYIWATASRVSEARKQQIKKVLTETISNKSLMLAGFGARGFAAVPDKELVTVCQRIKGVKNLPAPAMLFPLP